MNRIKRMFITLFTFLLILSTPITVLADNADGGGSAMADKSNAGGASSSKSGFRIYVVDKNGSLKSEVVDLVYKEPFADLKMLTNRFNNGTTKESNIYIMDDGMPQPFIFNNSFEGNGQAVKSWMRSYNESGEQNICALIYNYLGAEVLDLFKGEDEYFLCCESVAWHAVYTGHEAINNSGITFYGTFYNWMQLYAQLGLSDGGFTRNLDNNVLGRCMILAFDEPNLNLSFPNSTGFIDYNNLGNQGFGIQLYSNKESDNAEQSTYDEAKGDTPAAAPDESKGYTKIVKNYREKVNGVYVDRGCFLKESVSNQIIIENEQSYKVVSWKTSSTASNTIDSIKWNIPGKVTKQGTSTDSVELNTSTEKALYVLLEKSSTTVDEVFDGDYKIGESQISRKISLSTTDKGEALLSGHSFKYNFGSLEGTCGGHSYTCTSAECSNKNFGTCNCNPCKSDCKTDHNGKEDGEGHRYTHTVACASNGWTCGGHTKYCTTWSLDDKEWKLSIKNNKSNDFKFNLGLGDSVSSNSKTRDSITSGSTNETFNYDVVVHRGKDKLSLAAWKNRNASIEALSSFNATNSKTPTRKLSDYSESINFEFEDNSSDLKTSSKGNEGCTVSDTAALDNEYSGTIDLLYSTYAGKQSLIINNSINNSDMLTIGSVGNNVLSGRMVPSGLTFSFHPYIQMQYDTIDSSNNLIYVLGEYKRSINANDYSEIIWRKSDKPNLTLESTQWSIHATPFADLGEHEVLIPGGATMSVGIKKDDRQIVTVRTYQTILSGAGREQVEQTGGSVTGYNEETALQYHNEYAQSVVKGLEGIGIIQYENKNYEDDAFDGIKVYTGADISRLDNGSSKASDESKYYFKLNSNGADSGLLDVKMGTTTTQYFTFSSDVSGNILMNGQIILTKDQGIESLSGVAKNIDSRTMVVTKLVDALERDKGNDISAGWVSDGHWYNEAFDGITVAVSTTQIQTGFIQNSLRSTVIDPKLNTKAYGQTKLFRDNNNKPSYNSAAYKIENISNVYNEENVIGEFKGYPVKMDKLDMLYYSRTFYLSNISVQDLH